MCDDCGSKNGGAGDSHGGSQQSTEQICYPIDYVPYCLPGMPMQIIYTQLPGNPLFVPPCPPFCPMTDPCGSSNGNGQRNGNGKYNGNGNGGNGNGSGKRDGLQY